MWNENIDQDRWDENFQYFERFFTIEHAEVMEAFNGHGHKHSDGNDEAFLHEDYKFHFDKALKHFWASLNGDGIDKDSGHHHLALAILRMYMAQKVREK